ncbi:hypothetical protein [Legionella worsleiensis]|uniref:Uncharacterized protein n=1 Tax=Legionella worsleiensis TaxID=45076 RepID=A0A0W1A6B0_9GAMM|nr:hypothetical protein [Legionella worsleiensis]KTD76838.1 hypothetical protein Lwor_2063 [Legionella worsleiensis]STY33481.1 Uncharacterised protein [Legionella worsleiensis]
MLTYTSHGRLASLSSFQPKEPVLYTAIKSRLGLNNAIEYSEKKLVILNLCNEAWKQLTLNSDIQRDAQKLYEDVDNLILCKRNSAQFFEIITLGKKIDEPKLNKLINILESWDYPVANLVSGLLLEGRIRSVVKERDHPNVYWEKRIHDAITFYNKAATDKTLKPTVDFILWEIKTTSPIPSVQIRLSQYDLTPPATYIPTYNSFNAARSDVSFALPTLRSTLFFKPESISEQHIAEEINLTSQHVRSS